jgi:hypothetical protein
MADINLQSATSMGIYARDCSVSPGCTPSAEGSGPLPPLAEGVSNQVVGPATTFLAPASDPTDFPNLALVSSATGQRSFSLAGDNGAFNSPTLDSALYTQDSRVSVGDSAMQAYTWNGTGSATRTISGTVTLSESGGWPANGGSVASVGMIVFTTGSDTADFTCGQIPSQNIGSLCVKNATILSQNTVTEFGPLRNATMNLDLPAFKLTAPGETIFVLAASELFGNQGGYVSDPLVTTISDRRGLSVAAAPEIDPSSAVAALTLLAGCIVVLRSRPRDQVL